MVYNVTGDDGRFLFSASGEDVLKAILNLHPDAIERVKRETAAGGTCILHAARPPFLGRVKFLVRAQD